MAGRLVGRRMTALFASVLFLAVCLDGCGSKKKEYDYYISYVDSEQTRTVPFGYEPENASVDGLIQELLDQLGTDTDTVDYVKAITEGVINQSW